MIITNIVIILGIIWFYVCRFVHFYRIENPNISNDITLADYITLDKNITVSGSGLYNVDSNYVFIGNAVNNYIYYSGILFRIIEVNDNSIKIITEDPITSIFFGDQLDYSKSYVRKWLNPLENINYSGIFYNQLNNPDLYLNKFDFCIDQISNVNYSCNQTINDYVGLLTAYEYERAKGKESYLNINSYFWTSNTSTDNIWYVTDTGDINDNAFTEQNYYSYGVRPVINLKLDVKLVSGDGSKNSPYIIEQNYSNLLSSKNVGDFVKFNNYDFKIIEKNNNVTLALDGFIKNNDEDIIIPFLNSDFNNSILNYLNGEFYNSLNNKEYIIESKWYNGIYVNDYSTVYNDSFSANVGLLKVGDFYINDYEDYFLLNRNNDYDATLYSVLNKSRLYADLIYNAKKIRPAMVLDGNVVIESGNGTKENPYLIGGNNEKN